MPDDTSRERWMARAVESQMRRWELSQQVAAGRRADQAAQPSVSPLSIAVSRESGARGAAIARAVAERLGWQVYDQELIAYMANQMHVRQGLLESLDEKTLGWAREWLNIVLDAEAVDQEEFIANLTKVVLAIGLHGEAVFVGRGANFILPRDRTLTVRIIAPLNERVAYASQRETLSSDDARRRVTETDENRLGFIVKHFHKDVADPHFYDLVVDSSALGEDATTELIVRALEGRRVRIRKSAEPGRPR